MKKRFFSLLLACSVVLLSGCSDWEDTQQDSVFQTLQDYYGVKNEADDTSTSLSFFALPYYVGQTADPITCTDGAQQVLGTLLYEGLFALTPQLEPQPLLAESCTYDAASFTYTITLRSGITFSDGSELSARDVIYTLQRAQSSIRYSARLADMASISGSGNQVYLRLSNNNAAFTARLDIPIIKYATGDWTFPVGTGPYYHLHDSSGSHLAVNGSWWQKKELPLQRIELVRCKGSDTISYAFYAREIQLMMCDLTATSTSSVYGSGDYTDAATTTMQYIGLNTLRAPLNDPALRNALSLGVDRSSCVSSFLLGHGSTAQFPLSPASALYPRHLEHTYSPDYFDRAMAAVGYSTGTSVPLTMIVNAENTFKVSAAQKVAGDLSRHDLQITVRVLPWNEYVLALQSGNFDLYYGECKLTADWDLRSLLHTGGTMNYGGYSNPETDALVQTVLSAEESQRADAIESLCMQLQQQHPILPICFKDISVLLPSGAVESITPTAANPFYDLPSWDMDIQK